MIWAGGRGGGISHPGLALGKFLTHRLAGENRRFFKQPGKSECVSDLCDFLTRTSIVQSKSLTTPPIRTTKDASPCSFLKRPSRLYLRRKEISRLESAPPRFWAILSIQGDTQIPTLTGGVVRDLDWTKAVLVKKSHKSETHSDFPGCLKKRRFSPANLCGETSLEPARDGKILHPFPQPRSQ